MMTTPSRPSLGDWVMKTERTGCEPGQTSR